MPIRLPLQSANSASRKTAESAGLPETCRDRALTSFIVSVRVPEYRNKKNNSTLASCWGKGGQRQYSSRNPGSLETDAELIVILTFKFVPLIFLFRGHFPDLMPGFC